MNFLFALFLLEILMQDAQNSAIMILPMQMIVHLILSHHLQDLSNLSTKPLILSNLGIDLSIFEKSHHNIIFGKTNIRISLPPSYVREVWYYKKADVKSIQKAFLFRLFNG